MRFDTLNIPAFGPFTDFSLEFAATKYDVHLIYGANEAGKSSLLRAIHHLFFGFPSQTADNFLHANNKLLIGAAISHDEGKLDFLRRKGVKNTLLDAEQNTIPDAALEPFLGSVNKEFFEHMFGLNTDSLRSGAAKLLSGEGDLGMTIFSASLGGSPIDDAIKKLESEANSLCRGAAKVGTTILPALEIFKAAEKAARAEITTTTAWLNLQKEVGNARELFAAKDQQYRSHRSRWQFVENCLRAFPVLEAVRGLEAELSRIEAPDLPSDFPARVRKLQSQLVLSRQAYDLHKERLRKAEKQFKELGEFEGVIAASTDFEWLRRKSEQYADHLEAIPTLKSRLTEIDLDKLPAVGAAEHMQLKESAGILVKLQEQAGEVKKALENVVIELESRKVEATDPGDLTELEDRCQRADSFAADRAALPSLEKKLATLVSEQARLAARLEVSGDPNLLKVPGAKTIQIAERNYERLAEAVREVEGRLVEVRHDLAREQTSLDVLESQAAIYTRFDLDESRRERDEQWGEILKSKIVDESLTGAIARADEVADGLRDHADHIAVAAGHQAKIAQLQVKQTELDTDLKKAERALAEWQQEWGLNSFGKTPVELREWREDWEKLCGVVGEIESLEADIRVLEDRETKLLAEFGGGDFSEVHRSLKTALNRANQEQGELKALQKEMAKNEVRREQLERESWAVAEQLKAEKEKWDAVCASTGVSPNLSPKAAVEAVAEKMQARELLLEFQARGGAVEEYQKTLHALADRFGVEASEAVLSSLFEKAKVTQSRAQTMGEQLDQLNESLPAVRLAYESEAAEMADFVEQAGSDDLESVILKIESKAMLKMRLSEQKQVLQNFAELQSLEEFVSKLERLNPAELAAEKVTLDQAEEQLQRERDEARTHLDDQLRSQRELMKASDLSAAQKQAAADALATVVADTERFRQLHYAIDFLKEQVEEYRKKAQGPMIDKTSSFFKALTRGDFERVAAQLDEKGLPQLIAIRSGGEAVLTSGLSEGTADQLYLALRLSAIDLHLENHTPIPLILDDLLMTFDDDRTRALLPVLEDLSRKTQVLIFTHHSHLKELAGPEITIHDLPA